ncbi:MAG: patatin-like phospholipase family protein [Spirochaetales bacterium]|nr:patatin-like phospholipase family protein [Spirochaetales bacterium]
MFQVNRYLKVLTTLCLLFFAGQLAAQEGIAPTTSPEKDPVIALVLAGGGALGFAHVGVIKVLEEEGIQPDIIVGTSIGSIVGGLYSVGYTADELESLVVDTNWKEIFYDNPERRFMSYEQKERQSRYYLSLPILEKLRISDLGISHAQHVVELLDRLFQAYPEELDFDELPRRFRAVATDLITGERVVFDQGDLKTTIRASMAVPGAFSPVEYQGRHLIDGGWSDNLPANVARDMGADIIITVPLVTLKTSEEEISSLTDLGIQADHIRRNQKTEENIALSDLIIDPDVSGFTMADFEDGPELLERGYSAAQAMRREIRELAALQGDKQPPQTREDRDPEFVIGEIHANTSGDSLCQIMLEEGLTEELSTLKRASQIRETLYPYYDRGNFTHVWYHLTETEKGEYILSIDAPSIRDPEKIVSASAGIELTTGDSSLSSLYFNGAFTHSAGKTQNHRLTFDFSLSAFSDFQLLYDYFPGSGNTQISTQAYYFQYPRYFYNSDSVESLYGFNETGANIALKHSLFSRFEIALGAFTDYNYTSYRYGSRFYDNQSWIQGGARVMLAADTLDRLIAPQNGVKGETYLEISSNNQEAPIGQSKTALDFYLSPGKQEKWVGRFWVESHSLIIGEMDLMEYPSLGNSLPLYGYFPQEIRAENVALTGFALRRQIASLPLALGDEIYVQASFNGAGSWNNAVNEEYKEGHNYWGCSLGAMARTNLGEVETALAYNEDGRLLLHLSLKTSSNLLKEM